MKICKGESVWRIKLKLMELGVLKRLLVIAKGGLVVIGVIMTMVGTCVVCVVELIALPFLMIMAARQFVREWRGRKGKTKEESNDGKKKETDG